jgi:hypothetical protein
VALIHQKGVAAMQLVLGGKDPFALYDPVSGEHREVPVFTPAPKGEAWLDYNLPGGYQRADQWKGDKAEIAAQLKSRFDDVIKGFVTNAHSVGLSEFASEYVISELLQNATQYGRCSPGSDGPGLVSVKWDIGTYENTPHCIISVSNPVLAIFNPARYCNMTEEDFERSVLEGGNCHVGASSLIGFLKSGESLRYLWIMSNGERIVCEMSELSESDVASNQDSLNSNFVNRAKLSFTKYSNEGAPLPYSEDDFNRDVANKLAASTVTVSGVFAPK